MKNEQPGWFVSSLCYDKPLAAHYFKTNFKGSFVITSTMWLCFCRLLFIKDKNIWKHEPCGPLECYINVVITTFSLV